MANTTLNVSLKQASQQIRQRIKLGQEIMSQPAPKTIDRRFLTTIVDSLKKWDDYNNTFLRKLFSDESVADKYASASYMNKYTTLAGFQRVIKSFYHVKIRELESIKNRLKLYDNVSQGTHEISSTGVSLAKKVFVVHGRDENLRQSMFAFLRAIGIEPIEWNQAIAATSKASPYIGEILDVAFTQAKAIIVLASGDDEARLIKKFANPEDPEYETNLTPQPRPNVLFEAGLAMGRDQNRTILVEVGNLRPWSDIAGRHVTHLDNSPQKRNELAQKLKVAGCDIELSGQDWLAAGNFEELPREPSKIKLSVHDNVESHTGKSVESSTTEYEFSGTGPSTTRPFVISSTPWKLSYKVNWSGHFAVQVRGRSIELVVNRSVTTGNVYETYVHNQEGNLHFSIQEAPPDGDWTLWVTQGGNI